MPPETTSAPQEKSRAASIVIAIIVIAIIVAAAFYIWKRVPGSASPSWKSYHQNAVGLDVSYPSGWQVIDNLTANSCCLFIMNFDEMSTSTPKPADATKIQIGYYNKSSFDPFKVSSTSQYSVNGVTYFAGTGNGVPIYIIPRNDREGAGIAIFTAYANQQNAADIVKKMISTMKFTATTTATTSAVRK